MARITSILVVVLAITATSSAVLAIDCLSYLAADTALKKANNDAHAAYRKAVQPAETAWEEAIQRREAAWLEAGRAASKALLDADASHQKALESAANNLREAKTEANATRELADGNASARLTAALDKARTDIIGQAQTSAFRNAWDARHEARGKAFSNAVASPKFLARLKEELEARLALENALDKVPAEARAQYNETWIAIQLKYNEIMVAAVQAQRDSYAEADAVYQTAKTLADQRKASPPDAVHLKAGKDAYAAYWQTIHNAYFAYQRILGPAEADRLAAEAKDKDKWRETYIDIYKNPNIGLVRTVSGQSEEQLLELAEAERQKCPY